MSLWTRAPPPVYQDVVFEMADVDRTTREPERWEHAPGRWLAWNEYGAPDGFPVFYFHGWPSSRLQAGLAHEMAAARGLRLIAMDRPGMGCSTFEAERTLASWPELMERFANSLGIGKFGQLGVSGGGPYVMACAASIPERLAGSVVLGGAVPVTAAGGPRGLHPAYRMLIPFRNLPGAVFSPVFRTAAWSTQLRPDRPPLSWLLRTLAKEDGELLSGSPELWDFITGSFREGVSQNGGRGVMADAAIYFQPPPDGPRQTVRWWHGADDRNIPIAMVRRFLEQMPGAELIEETGLGHFSLVIRRAPDALDYLAERAAAARS